ncbi:MAG: alpha/beta fold hydrolase [Gammaproteobacteria bacterium]
MTRPIVKKEQLHGGRREGKPVPLSLSLMRFMFSRAGALVPGIMGRWAYHLWFRTRRFPEAAAGKRAAASSRREILQVDDMPVAIYTWGEGPAVLFVHGWSGRGSQVAAFVEPLNRAGYRVIAVDLPGHGDSPGNSTNILACAAVLQAIARDHGPVYAAITHSFGGMVLAYAMKQGMPAGRVVSICAPANAEFLLETFAQTLRMHKSVIDDMWRRLEQRFGGDFGRRIATTNNVKGLIVPALVIHDEDDAGVPWQHGRMIADAWHGAEFLKTKGLGHGRILRDAQTIQAAVDFISR